jgi:hypothetical protein
MEVRSVETTVSETALGIAMTTIPFLALGAVLWLRGLRERREAVRIIRQIGLTDAIHRELGAAAAPWVGRSWLYGWTVSVAVPLTEEKIVGAVVRIAQDFFARVDPTDARQLRVILTPWDRRFVRPATPSAVSSATGGTLARAA